MDKSILFVRPDYHCTFAYRDRLRKMGWKADILVNKDYPKYLLYSLDEILEPLYVNMFPKFANHLLKILSWFYIFWRYKYHVYYGRPPFISYMEDFLGFTKILGSEFRFELWLSKLLGIKLIYLPTGCKDEDTKENYLRYDNGNVCSNCGHFELCDDTENAQSFAIVNRFFDMVVSPGENCSSQFDLTEIKYKSVDLNSWKPNMTIPKEFKLPQSDSIRVFHVHLLKHSGRLNLNGKNIKGTPAILKAIQKLNDEGYDIELMKVPFTPSDKIKYYQMQADIVIDQLIYGSWGSTAIEALALGKPVVCYLRPSWKRAFLKRHTQHKSLPIIEANTLTIYDELKKFANLPVEERKKLCEGSRLFAEKHFNPIENVSAFVSELKKLR